MEEKDVKGYIVDGYLFADQKEAQTAQKELQGIRYLQRNNNLKDAKVMLQIYQKLLSQGMFHTPVGLNYLKQLQDALRAKGITEDIPPIPAVGSTNEKTLANMKNTMTELNDVGGRYRRRYRIALAVMAIMAAGLVFVTIVAATTNQPHILNYEEKIIDKYEQWEQELETREQRLKEKSQ